MDSTTIVRRIDDLGRIVGGIAVKSVKNGYQVLKRISDDKIMIWFRG